MTDTRPYILVDLEQGTPAWHEWRRDGIGASEAATIMGENRWNTAKEHLESRCGLRKSKASSPAMERGTALEPEARLAYEMKVSIFMTPVCVQSVQYAWLRASLDGMSSGGQRAVEIKCGQGVYRETAMFRRVPANYMPQLQHIMAVTGLPEMDFWCYWPRLDPVHLRVPRDNGYIRRLMEVEYLFWEMLTEARATSAMTRGAS